MGVRWLGYIQYDLVLLLHPLCIVLYSVLYFNSFLFSFFFGILDASLPIVRVLYDFGVGEEKLCFKIFNNKNKERYIFEKTKNIYIFFV